MGDGSKVGGRLIDCVGVRSKLAMALCKAESEVEIVFAFMLAVGKRRMVPFVGESPVTGS